MDEKTYNPNRALTALCIGFFMILVDSTIVSVAVEAMRTSLNASLNAVLWTTSAYLLAYAVPMLITGRMGDRFGAKNMYMIGLFVFTTASAWCGLSTSINMLIVARVVQGLGAAAMSPQTMAIITRIFPPERRGKAMGIWGATAGIASLVGPILGGLLIDYAGWEWIFFINVPVGIIGLIYAWKVVPQLPVHSHSFDWLGVVLSALALFCIVFGIQEGSQYNWGTITGWISVPLLIVAGLIFGAAFAWWQSKNPNEPLVPLSLFKDRNFSLANIAIVAVGFGVTAMSFPFMIYAQAVRGYTPTEAALILAPMAVVSGVLAPVVGGLVDKYRPSIIAAFGLTVFSLGMLWYAVRLHADTSLWEMLAIAAVLGVANGFMWAPITITATRTLSPRDVGAGSGVFNVTRQLGCVLGSASVASLMDARLRAHLGAMATGGGAAPMGTKMPPQVAEQFSRAMGEAYYLPAAVLVIGIVAAAMFSNPHASGARADTPA